jgi:pyruvate-ferredoxin/flavodoxin oxidoreductase
MQKRRPAVINIYTPCPVEHGLADEWAPHAAKLALESRAFPFITYDPDAGATLADCLSLDGNPALDAAWPTYTLEFKDDGGKAQKMELPLTVADWAATEGRFKKQFKKLPEESWNEDHVPFAEYLELSAEDRDGKTPFIHVVNAKGKLGRLGVSDEIVHLATERQQFWNLLREMAGLRVSDSARDVVTREMETEFEAKLSALRADYEARIANLQATYPVQVARRMAEALLRGDHNRTVAEILATAPAVTGALAADLAAMPGASEPVPAPKSAPVVAGSGAPSVAAAVAAAPAAGGVAVAESDELVMEAYIESPRCTTCNECTNLNNKLFAYNADKQAYIKDAKAGTFQQLVTAAERCPVSIIHPGTPLNPKEKDLAKWVERAKRFA